METTTPQSVPLSDISTPAGNGGFLAGLVSGQTVPAIAARVGAAVASLLGRPLRVGNKVIAARHADVVELLERDLEFRIGPINEVKIDAVNGGPFVLGMDRGYRLAREREALYRALAEVDLVAIRDGVSDNAEKLLRDKPEGGEIDVVGGYARPIAAQTAQHLFGIGQGIDPRLFMDAVRAIFAHTFLNQSDQEDVKARALRAGALMRTWFEAEIAKRRASGDFGCDMMGALLRSTWLDDDAVRRTLGGMLVGSIDTTASSVAKIVAGLVREKGTAGRIAADLTRPDHSERLAGWCWELLRRWPHNPVIIRQANVDTVLNSVAVKRGDQVVAWTQAAMQDPTVFPRPGLMRPDRPMENYLHFGGGLHPCAGRAVNAFQIPLLVGALVRRGFTGAYPIAWAGPFPDHLTVRLERPAA